MTGSGNGGLPGRASYGLYVHLPFCARRCSYCTFISTVDVDRVGEVVEATAAEIRRLLPRRPLATLYLGGGTPSLVPIPLLEEVFRAVAKVFLLQPRAEVTLEANPEDVTSAALDAWRRLGVNRLSLGVQALDDDLLGLLQRRHDAGRARSAVANALAAGFSVSVDLMLGLPGLSPAAAEVAAQELAVLGPQHLSVYLLELDKPHALGQLAAKNPGLLPGDDEVADSYVAVAKVLRRAGYRHYEVSNFALPGCHARHNLRTWRQRPLLAVGVAAHGHCGRVRWGNLEDLGEYVRVVTEGARPLAWRRVLSPDELERERVMLALRLAEGVDWATAARVGHRHEAFAQRLEEFLSLGLARRWRDRVRLLPRGWLVSNELLHTLW